MLMTLVGPPNSVLDLTAHDDMLKDWKSDDDCKFAFEMTNAGIELDALSEPRKTVLGFWSKATHMST